MGLVENRGRRSERKKMMNSVIFQFGMIFRRIFGEFSTYFFFEAKVGKDRVRIF